MPPSSRITRLLERQGEELAKLQDQQARKVLVLAEQARQELRARLAAMVATGRDQATPYTAQHMRVVLAQSEHVVTTLRQRLDAELYAAKSATARASVRDLLHVIRANEREFTDVGNRIEIEAVARLSQQDGLLLHRYSLDRYGAELIGKIQQQLSISLFTGDGIPQMTKRIAGTSGVFARQAHRAELIARMEMNRAYSDGHQAALETAAVELDPLLPGDPMMRQANEFMDTRNHPISPVIDGLVTGINQPWLVPVAEVFAAAQRLKKATGGVLWPDVGGFYVVGGYQVHFGERGRMVPYRASWDGGAALKGMDPAQVAKLPREVRATLAA